METKHVVFSSAGFGWCGIVRGQKGLLRVFLPEPERFLVCKKIKESYPFSVFSNGCFAKEERQLEKYFSGLNQSFSFNLDFMQATEFQIDVWNATSEIPYGEVRSYSWVACRIRKPQAVRAVGNALGRNPFPVIIPCHRVVRKNGHAGGFSAVSGTRLKEKLLEMETGLKNYNFQRTKNDGHIG